jgi:hypothetical protein
VVIVGALVAVLDLTPFLRITYVRVSGATPELEHEIRERVLADAAVSYFGHRFAFSTLLHADVAASRARIIADHPELTDVSVRRDWPRTILVGVTERIPAGIWCRGGQAETCRFWDRSGSRWGAAIPSTGPLFVLVIDERHDDEFPDALRAGMLAALDGISDLGMAARRIILPDAEPGGMRLETASGTVLALDALGDMADQLGTLKVFLAQRGDEALPGLIDLRTPGRVYFKTPAQGN